MTDDLSKALGRLESAANLLDHIRSRVSNLLDTVSYVDKWNRDGCMYAYDIHDKAAMDALKEIPAMIDAAMAAQAAQEKQG